MQIVIHTANGTYLVQQNKQLELLQWLENNAVKAGPKPVKEQSELLPPDSSYKIAPEQSKFLINETF